MTTQKYILQMIFTSECHGGFTRQTSCVSRASHCVTDLQRLARVLLLWSCCSQLSSVINTSLILNKCKQGKAEINVVTSYQKSLRPSFREKRQERSSTKHFLHMRSSHIQRVSKKTCVAHECDAVIKRNRFHDAQTAPTARLNLAQG